MKREDLQRYSLRALRNFALELRSFLDCVNTDPTRLKLNNELTTFINRESTGYINRAIRVYKLIKDEVYHRFMNGELVGKPSKLDIPSIEAKLAKIDIGKGLKEYAKKIKAEEEIKNSQLMRFHAKYANMIDEVIEHIMQKYESDAYVNKEYKLGYEPRRPLYYFLFDYATKRGDRCRDERYMNPFTGGIYYLGSYVIQIMHGQGSVIKIDKQRV